MSDLLPLQVLPLHVARMIVDHVVGSSRLELDGLVNSSDRHKVLLQPLLSVCRNIRAAAILRFSKVFTIRLSTNPYEDSEILSYWTIYFNRASFPTQLFAQVLNFDLDIFDVFRGTALRELSQKPFAGLTFSKVNSVTVAFTPMSTMPHPADIMSSPQDIESNLSAFVRRIKQMAPLAKNVALTLTASIIDIPLFGDRHRGSLVRQICQLADNVEYNVYYHPMSMDLQPTGVRETIITDINGNDISELAMQLARRSASTLHFLGMTFCGLNNIGPLIKDAEGCYIQYPRLHKLKLANSQSLDVVQRPAFPGVVPFPVLRNLTIGSEYYFGDDTPFRGNTGTLAYLELDLNARVISVIKMRKVFTPSSHPKLHRIKLRQRAELTQTKFGTDVEFMRFVLSIGPSAPVREVYSLLGLRGLHDVIPVLANYTCLQVLGLPYSPLWLWGVFALVKALPLLSNLHTYLPSVGLLPQGVSEKRLPAYVRETYSPMGEYLRRWRIGASTGADFESTAKCVLFLALVCPNFDYAAVPEAGRELFMAHLKEMISSNGLKQHEPRLQRLLFGGWRNRGFSVKVAHTRRAIAAEAAAQT